MTDQEATPLSKRMLIDGMYVGIVEVWAVEVAALEADRKRLLQVEQAAKEQLEGRTESILRDAIEAVSMQGEDADGIDLALADAGNYIFALRRLVGG